MATNECKGCGDPLTTPYQIAAEYCDWCDAERMEALYDQDDAADDVQQQMQDERGEQ